MAGNTTYLITGANRGIGLGLTASLLQRPNTTVIATVRDKSMTDCSELEGLPLATGSGLYIESLAVADEKSPKTLVETIIQTHKIGHIDVVIANAGFATFTPTLETSSSSFRDHFETNTLGSILLFQSLHALLAKSATPKFVVISSVLGSASLTALPEAAAPTLAYGVSKAGVNFFVRKLHCEMAGLVTLAVHPGWVKTANGQAFADSIGVAEPPLTVERSADGVLQQIGLAKKDTTSGSFVSYDGTTLQF